MSDKRYLTAGEAADALGISRATLYAYVSRGLIRSEETPGKSRAKRYYRADVEALLRRKAARQNPEQAAAAALHFGDPVLPSALTLIEDGRLYYRGHDVLHLAQNRSFEETAALLWTGEFDPGDYFAPLQAAPPALPPEETELSPIARFQILLPAAAAADLAAFDRSPPAVARRGGRILHLLTAAVTGHPPTGPLAGSLQLAWRPQRPETAALLNAALILCADHELNVSSFTARSVASAHATPYGVALAGLAALEGARHGGYTGRVEALFREAGAAGFARETVAGRLRRGAALPGFGHRLYPEGDPRARLLLERVTAVYPDHPAVHLAGALVEAAGEATGRFPNVDFALVALSRALGRPPGTALALFALGRTAGWIGHAIEQYAREEIIRPRARYVGPAPVESE